MSDKAKPRRRAPRKATPGYLERAALFYLERYAGSSSSLRRVLLRKVARSAEEHGTDPAEGAAAVETLISRLQDRGLVNDAAFAESRARALRRRGASAAGVRARLAAKGITAELAQQALSAVAEETPGDEELAAAVAFARRRRLGPWRAPEQRAERRQRDLAALGRQGFPGTLARRVIDAEDPQTLEQQLAETRHED